MLAVLVYCGLAYLGNDHTNLFACLPAIVCSGLVLGISVGSVVGLVRAHAHSKGAGCLGAIAVIQLQCLSAR